VPSLPGWRLSVNTLYPPVVESPETVSVNGGARSISVEAGRPLLFGLMDAGIYIPSACGGRGSCGQCRVRISGRAPQHTSAEATLLSEADRAGGVRLSCQVLTGPGLSIEIEERHLAARQFRAVVAGARPLTWEIAEITLSVIDPEDFAFEPGQYVQVFVPGTQTAAQPLYRAYSMASPPAARLPGGSPRKRPS